MSFNAQTTWDVWREILREPNVQTILRTGELDKRIDETSFTGEKVEIARYYQSNFKDAEWFVTSYRFRLVSAFLNAIELGAPLTHRVLLARDHDMRKLAETFFDATEWFDDGPFVYRQCSKILDWMQHTPDLADVPELSAVTQLEAAAVGVLRDAADIDQATWSQPLLKRSALQAALDQGKPPNWTGLVRVVETDHDVAPLFSVKEGADEPATVLQKQTSYFAAYLPSPKQRHRFARIKHGDFVVAQTLSSGVSDPSFCADNIDSIVRFAKIRGVQIGD